MLKGGTSETKIQELEYFIGSSTLEQVEIYPPKQLHTKGGGKRIKGGKEEATEKQKKTRVYHAYGKEEIMIVIIILLNFPPRDGNNNLSKLIICSGLFVMNHCLNL